MISYHDFGFDTHNHPAAIPPRQLSPFPRSSGHDKTSIHTLQQGFWKLPASFLSLTTPTPSPPPRPHHHPHTSSSPLHFDTTTTTTTPTSINQVSAVADGFCILPVSHRHTPPIPTPTPIHPPSRDTSLNHHLSSSRAVENCLLPTCRRHPPPNPALNSDPFSPSHDTDVNYHESSWAMGTASSACRLHHSNRSIATLELNTTSLPRPLLSNQQARRKATTAAPRVPN